MNSLKPREAGSGSPSSRWGPLPSPHGGDGVRERTGQAFADRPVHLVYLSDDFEKDVARAIAAGGKRLIEPVQIKAGFGERKLTFIRAPGGWNFEIFKMIQDFVPEVPKYKSRLKGLWTCGTKVPDIDRELKFHRDLGNAVVLDETIESGGGKFRLPLVRMADKYIHVLDKAVYEDALGK